MKKMLPISQLLVVVLLMGAAGARGAAGPSEPPPKQVQVGEGFEKFFELFPETNESRKKPGAPAREKLTEKAQLLLRLQNQRAALQQIENEERDYYAQRPIFDSSRLYDFADFIGLNPSVVTRKRDFEERKRDLVFQIRAIEGRLNQF